VHELSIAMSLVAIACEERERLGGGRVEVVHVRVGRLSSVVPHALRVSFDAAIQGSGIDGAELAIEPVPVAMRCDACGADSDAALDRAACCPGCGGSALRIVRGRELELFALEFADDPDC
jgi:hydrogenase nickel incorporation protein HypA/HybF